MTFFVVSDGRKTLTEACWVCISCLILYRLSDEGEDDREDTALSAAENEDDDTGRKSAASAVDEVSAADEASRSDAASRANDVSQADDADVSAGDEDANMSAGDEDEDVDVEAAESDKASAGVEEQTPEQKIADADDRTSDR